MGCRNEQPCFYVSLCQAYKKKSLVDMAKIDLLDRNVRFIVKHTVHVAKVISGFAEFEALRICCHFNEVLVLAKI